MNEIYLSNKLWKWYIYANIFYQYNKYEYHNSLDKIKETIITYFYFYKDQNILHG